MRLIVLFCLIPFITFAQSANLDSLFKSSGELFFSFEVDSKEQLNSISKIVSIDHGTQMPKIFAYANKKEFAKFSALGIPFNIEQNPGSLFKNLNMLLSLDEKQNGDWDFYPSYDVYLAMMYAFEEQYPNLCKVSSIGSSVDGRALLVAKLSDSLQVKENEPKVLYTSSIHGDEISGFVLSLRLIDYLLANYRSDTRISAILNNVEVWINPLANPDGAYRNNNNSVFDATRYNANWVDLNRNYPDPEDGLHPDGNAYQTETLAFMAFADSVGFDMSSNFHGGTVVANYPWDTWESLPADYDWWVNVMNEYASSAQQNSFNGYFSQYDNGITNGYDWYEVAGGRQDYMNYYENCREFTLEISSDKTPEGNDLPFYWNANYNSLMSYIEQSLFGLRGIVTDSITGEALLAEVFIENHDVDNSQVYSHLPVGNYHRFLSSGMYSITFSCEEYTSKTLTDISVLNNETTLLDVQLVKNDLKVKEKTAVTLNIYPQPASSFVTISGLPKNASSLAVLDTQGRRVRDLSTQGSIITLNKQDLSSGLYFIVYTIKGQEYKTKFVFR